MGKGVEMGMGVQVLREIEYSSDAVCDFNERDSLIFNSMSLCTGVQRWRMDWNCNHTWGNMWRSMIKFVVISERSVEIRLCRIGLWKQKKEITGCEVIFY